MLWSALLLQPTPCQTTAEASASRTDRTEAPSLALQALAIWALQFTPRVAVAKEAGAVVMEVEGSVRLFGGERALRERVRGEGAELGVARLAWAPNSLAALALARAGVEDGLHRPLFERLDVLPLACLSAAQVHRATLEPIGCRTLGDVRRLPRGGIARRFDAQLLAALDRAYGLAPETHEWVTLPGHFQQRLELMCRVDDAPALMQGAGWLLRVMAGWLAARHSGVTAFTLRWLHDAMRSRAVGAGGGITIRTAAPTRDVDHLGRLLAEHLNRIELPAPVSDLVLHADEVHPLAERSASLLPPDATQQDSGEALHQVLERLEARLGPQRVLQPVPQEDHRPEAMCRWQPVAAQRPAASAPSPRQPAGAKAVVAAAVPTLVGLPQPTFLLPEPLKLLVQGHRPVYQGTLQLLLGPQRVDGAWWDRDETTDHTRQVTRDYWVAQSPQAGVLWVFQTRLGEAPAWFLHGFFG